MRRSNFILKVIAAMTLLALVSYLGFYVYNSVANPFNTALAIGYTTTRGYQTEGVCIRSEEVLSGSGELLEVVPGEGEKVAVGGVLAVKYGSEKVLKDADEISAIKAQIEQLNEVLLSAKAGTELLTIDKTARELTLDLQTAICSRDFSSLVTLTAKFKTLMYYSDDGSGASRAEQKLGELSSQLKELEKSFTSGASYIYSNKSGLFSSVVDGFENLSPSDVSKLTAEQVRSVMSAGTGTGKSGMGKLVSGTSWYYAVLLPSAEAELLDGKKIATLSFERIYAQQLTMKIESIGKPETDGNCLVVFSCERALRETISARKLSGKLVYSTISGIKVPKKAVKLGRQGQNLRVHAYRRTGGNEEYYHT